MTKAGQKQRAKEFVARGEEIGKAKSAEFSGLSQVKNPQYETWIKQNRCVPRKISQKV